MNIDDVMQFANNKFIILRNPADFYNLEEDAQQAVREKLEIVLLRIIMRKGKLKETEFLNDFIDIGNNLIIDYEIKNGRLIKTTKIKRQHCYSNFVINIISTFLDYLSDPQNDLRKIKRCHDCKDFYIQPKLNALQKYCHNCSKRNHTPKDVQVQRTHRTREAIKKRKKKEKRKALFDKKFNQLLKEGFKKNQAKELAEQYVIEQLPVIE